jgi:hypothetical protein
MALMQAHDCSVINPYRRPDAIRRLTCLSRPGSDLGRLASGVDLVEAAVHPPDPPVIACHGRQLRVRDDDPHLGVHAGSGQQLQATV